MNRATLTKVHMLLAAFMFPVALMFLVTGGLYTWGISGDYETTDHKVTLSAPMMNDEKALSTLAATELAKLGVAPPSGNPRVRSIGDNYNLEWSGSQRDVLLAPTDNPLEAKLTVKETSWYRHLVQLHKAKGGTLFKLYAAALAVALFILLGTGFLMAWKVPSYRRATNISAGAGLLFFIGAALLS